MDFHHRKMLNDSVEKPCKSYCDPIKNPDGSCPIDCIATCFPICYRPLYYELPPPAYADHSGSDAHPSRPLGLSVFLSVCLAVLATAFFLFSCFTLYKFYRGRRNSSRSMRSSPQQPPPPLAASSLRRQEEAHLEFDQGPVVDHPIWYIRTVGLPPSVISAIPISKYKRGDRLVEGTDCSVCLSEFQDGETLRLLPKCGHAFHISCIDAWLGSHTNCPNCRARIVSSTENLQTPAQDLQNSVFNSGGLEEFQLGESGNVSNRESERERESEILGVNLDVEDEEESRRNESFIEGNSGGSRDMEEGIQPMRRSVSMEALSASMINALITNATSAESGNKDKNFAERNGSNVGVGNDLVCSSSTERCLQKETSLVKRSLSCSAKLFLSRYSKSRNPSLPP